MEKNTILSSKGKLQQGLRTLNAADLKGMLGDTKELHEQLTHNGQSREEARSEVTSQTCSHLNQRKSIQLQTLVAGGKNKQKTLNMMSQSA